MIRNYLKIALKVLGRRKFFTFISLFGIGVTLMVLLVATALLDYVFAARTPEVHADRMLGVYRLTMKGAEDTESGQPGYAFLDRTARPLAKLPGVERIAFVTSARTAVSYLNGRKIQSAMRRADGEFWRVLAFDFVEGGPFTVDDDAAGRFVAVISETTRERFFGRQPAVGKVMEVDGQRFRVVGVVRDVPILRYASSADLWVPVTTAKTSAYKSEWLGDFSALILARGPADLPQIKAEYPVAPAGGGKAPPRPQDVQVALRGRRHAVRGGLPRLPARRGDGGQSRGAAVGGAARADAGLHAAADDQSDQHQPEPHPRPGVGDRRAPGVRRLLAHARGTVPDRKHGADADRRRGRPRARPRSVAGVQRERPDRAQPFSDQRPDLPLRSGDRSLLRPLLGGLSRLADVEAPPRPALRGRSA